MGHSLPPMQQLHLTCKAARCQETCVEVALEGWSKKSHNSGVKEQGLGAWEVFLGPKCPTSADEYLAYQARCSDYSRSMKGRLSMSEQQQSEGLLRDYRVLDMTNRPRASFGGYPPENPQGLGAKLPWAGGWEEKRY